MVSGTEPIILIPASRVYPQIVTVPASPTMEEDVTDEALYSQAGPIDRETGDIRATPVSRTIKYNHSSASSTTSLSKFSRCF